MLGTGSTGFVEGLLRLKAEAAAAAGQHEQAAAIASQAETVARSITDPGWQAETMARSITDPDRQAQALTEVAGALARAGLHEQAETVARSITDPGWQVDALAEVGRVLVARGDTRRAHHVASAACAVGRWTKVLGLVLSVESSAVRVLTEVQ